MNKVVLINWLFAGGLILLLFILLWTNNKKQKISSSLRHLREQHQELSRAIKVSRKNYETACNNLTIISEQLTKKEEISNVLEKQLQERKDFLDLFIEQATKREEQAADAILKEYELKREQLKVEKENEIKEMIQSLESDKEFQEMKKEIEIVKRTYEALQQEKKRRDNIAGFEKKHSLNFSISDQQDVEMIKALIGRLNRKNILSDILWTIYYQKPLKDLRADVFGKVSNKMCGIYRIALKDDPTLSYIGQARDISNRWTEHVKAALKGETSKFYKAFRENGPESFTFEIIEECEENDLNERERYWIDFYGTCETGLNTQIGG